MQNARTYQRRRKYQGQKPAAEQQNDGPGAARGPLVQPQDLKVGAPNDKYEAEADHMADQVVSKPAPAGVQRETLAQNASPLVQRQAPEEEPAAQPLAQRMEEEEPAAQPLAQRMEEEEQAQPIAQRAEEEEQAQPLAQRQEEEEMASPIQRQEEEESVQQMPLAQRAEEEEQAQPMAQRAEEEEMASPIQRQTTPAQSKDPSQQLGHPSRKQAGVREATPWASQKIAATRGQGQKLPKQTRQFMEQRFGADFGKVRIHNDDTAHKLSKNLHAQAFTVGHDVYFNKGYFNPNTKSGQHLLAHELTHTIQQKGWAQRQEEGGVTVDPTLKPKPNQQGQVDTIKVLGNLDIDYHILSNLSVGSSFGLSGTLTSTVGDLEFAAKAHITVLRARYLTDSMQLKFNAELDLAPSDGSLAVKRSLNSLTALVPLSTDTSLSIQSQLNYNKDQGIESISTINFTWAIP